VHGFLRRLTGSDALADDLAQETFLRIHRARGGFHRGGAALPWAYAIARNAWIDHTRSAKARRALPLATSDRESDPGHDPGSGPDDDAEAVAIAREVAARVEVVLAGLPTNQREAFVLLRYERMSVQQAAEVLGATPTAVKLRAFRAYEALRAALGVGGGGEAGDAA
jgi:RNA polymerase sigma-70 factor (ECF subfamily)